MNAKLGQDIQKIPIIKYHVQSGKPLLCPKMLFLSEGITNYFIRIILYTLHNYFRHMHNYEQFILILYFLRSLDFAFLSTDVFGQLSVVKYIILTYDQFFLL